MFELPSIETLIGEVFKVDNTFFSQSSILLTGLKNLVVDGISSKDDFLRSFTSASNLTQNTVLENFTIQSAKKGLISSENDQSI